MKKRPFEVDATEYPFNSRWFERDACAMHYIDEGQGIPIVLCHGNPTWSYLYRNVIKELSPDFRCIAYDLPGFGFSDHPADYGYTPQEHSEWLETLLIDHLKLDRFILVVQDWGGPIGLNIASRHPEKVLGIVISSTFIGTPTRVGRIFSGLMGSKIGQYLIYNHNLFASTLMRLTLGKKATKATLKAYRDPFPNPASRKGTAVFPIQIVAASPWLEEIKGRLHTLADKPVEFVFGLRDMGTRASDIANWLTIFPEAGVQKIASANHFTQEDCPECYGIAVKRIAAKLRPPE